MTSHAQDVVSTANGMELRHLRALVALAQEVHYGRAAMRLHLAQSTLSRTVADLEALVGFRLVDRSQRTIGLTEPGRALLGAAETALAAVQHGLEATRRADATVTTLGLMSAYGYRWLPALRRVLPEATLEVRPIGHAEGFKPLGRDVDVGVFPLPMVTPSGFRWRTLAMAQCWVALPESHPLAQAPVVTLAAIAGEPLVVAALDELWLRDLELIFRAQGLDLCLGPEPATMSEALGLVAEGEGWALATSRADFHVWEGVVFCPLSGMGEVRIAAVWEDERMRPATAGVIDALEAIARVDAANWRPTGRRDPRGRALAP